MNNEELRNVNLFEEMLKEIFVVFPYIKSIKITNVGKTITEDPKASSPVNDSMYISCIDLEVQNRQFIELNSIDKNKVKSLMLQFETFKSKEKEQSHSANNYEEYFKKLIDKDFSSINLNKLVTIAALESNLISKIFLNKATDSCSSSQEFVFTSENIKDFILNKEFFTHLNNAKELGTEEFRKTLLSKPKLF